MEMNTRLEIRNARRIALALLIGTLVGIGEATLGLTGIILITGALTATLAALLILERVN